MEEYVPGGVVVATSCGDVESGRAGYGEGLVGLATRVLRLCVSP